MPLVTNCNNSDSEHVQMNECGVRLLFSVQGCGKEHRLWRQEDLDEKTLGDPKSSVMSTNLGFLICKLRIRIIYASEG